MNPSLLEPDELKIECEIRNIQGLTSVQVSMLEFVLQEESQQHQEEPNVSHLAARKNPRRELTLCAGKIVEMQEFLVKSLQSDSQHKLLIFKAMKSRALHYRYRLNRISASPCIAVEYEVVSRLCEQLIHVLNNTDDSNESSLHETLPNLKEVDTSLAKPLIDSDRVENSKESISGDLSTSQSFPPGSSKQSITFSESDPTRGSTSKPLNVSTPPESSPSTSSGQPITPIGVSSNSSGNSINNNQNSITVPSNLCDPNAMQQLGSLISQLNLLNVSNPLRPSSAPTVNVQNNVPVVPQPNVSTAMNPNVPNNFLNEVNQLSMLLSRMNANNSHLGNLSGIANPVSSSVPVASSPHLEVNDFEVRPNSMNNDLNPRVNYNIHKWNLFFDGSKTGLNVDRFLYRVETNASVYNIPSYRLMSDIQYLLKGKALNWFWSFKENKRPTSWSELRNAMICQFKDEHNDFDVRQSICERKQKTGESFQDFYAIITEMTLGLSEPLKDFDLMLILHGNMRLGLKEKLAGKRFNTSLELFNECVYIENTWRQISYIPEKIMLSSYSRPVDQSSRAAFPSSRSVHEIEQDNRQLSETVEPQSTNNDSQLVNVCAFNLPQNYHNKGKFTQTTIPQHILDKVQCWNCKLFGHFYYKCDKDLLHVFCRGCGQSDITLEYCVKCQGNMKREVKTGGPSFPNTHKIPEKSVTTEEAASNTDPEFYHILKRNQL